MKLTDTLGKQQRSPRKLFVIFITNCMLYIQEGFVSKFYLFIVYFILFWGWGGGRGGVKGLGLGIGKGNW